MPRLHWSFFMPAQDHRFIKWLFVYFQARLTQSGKIVFGAIFIGAAMAAPGTFISAYLLPCFCLAFLITAFVFSLFYCPKVTALRLIPAYPTAGEDWVYQVVVKNTGKRPLRNTCIFEGLLPYGLYIYPYHAKNKIFIEWLEPGEETTLQLVMRCPQRGVYDLPQLLAGSSFPGGLLRKVVKVGSPQRLAVYPRFVRQSAFAVPVSRTYQPGGVTESSRVGDSNEFLSTREFRQGDRWRDIHWASSARTGKLIVKEYVEEYFLRTGIVLDTQSPFWQPPQGFEKCVSLAAGIAQQLISKDVIVDILVMEEKFRRFSAGRSLASRDQVLEFLAGVEEQEKLDFKFLETPVFSSVNLFSCVVVLLATWDESRAQFVERLKETNVKLRVVLVASKPPSAKLPEGVLVVAAKDYTELIQ